nr:hypothetical protein [Gemmatimonadaceae bacterium]
MPWSSFGMRDLFGALRRAATRGHVPADGVFKGSAARRAQAATLLQRLRALGLRGIDTVALMHTRRTMVSVAGST